MDKQNLTILLVDDDFNERSGVRFLIEREQFPLTILEAPNGKRALELMQTTAVDILFTDIKMPYMDGLELSAAVHKNFTDTKIIIFSAYGEFDYAKKAMESSVVNYLLKPVDIQEFRNVMSSVIEKCHAEKALAEQRNRRILADKTLRWIRLLTGKQSITEETRAILKEQGYPVEEKVALLYMETQEDFFAASEPEVVDCLTDCVRGRYVYVNLYPNSSYVVLFGEKSKQELQEICDSVLSCAEDTEISFFADDVPFDFCCLSQRVRKVEEIRRQMFVWNAGVLFFSDLSELMNSGFADVEMIWGQTSRAILSRDKTIILNHVNDLLDSMASHNLLSSAYIYHIFCDLLGKIYAEYGYSNSQGMLTAIRQLGGCRSKQILLLLVSNVLDEVGRKSASKQDVAMQDTFCRTSACATLFSPGNGLFRLLPRI